MVKVLIDIAFGESRVTKIIADTLPERNASTRVLEKNGFRLVKEMDDASDGLVWRWGLEKSH
jgi:RimJ/RimL family protein N-acetyltransferase